ncbi:hypothetical protein FLAPJACK_77 [Bacillus phage Flapjack]|uniref:Uncharacterized protein n=1 Tax=Bacillus phage Flapjack TaxID=1983465 RepID=A0A1X9SFZ4_9CAUD|nr:hypothetical protein FLAPJACK_77 [Bacillus phage Flapjack]
MADKPYMLQATAQATHRLPDLDSHIDNFAQRVLWEKSYLCPCRDRATRQPQQSCKICHGRGIAYLPAKEIGMMIQSQEKGVFNGDLGLIDTGSAIGTPERATRVAFRDRITVPRAVISQSFIFDASKRRIEHGFFMVYDVKKIEFVTSMQGELLEGQDYTVDYNKNLFFPKEHLEGHNISINIDTTLRYLVADLLKEHRYVRDMDYTQHNAVQKILLKREDIFIDKEAFETGVNNKEVDTIIDAKRKPSTDGLNGFFKGIG